MSLMELIDSLFKQGLGELPIFYSRLRGVYLGNMVYIKGRIFFKDKGFLQDIEFPNEQPDWDKHILGMVCYRKLLQWESLSFFGLDYCELNKPVDTEHIEFLKSVTNTNGERLYDFVGSIYRACYLMLDNGLLPVVLLRSINSKGSGTGLIIADLRPLLANEEKYTEIQSVIRESIQKRATLELEDITEDEID